jgi:hypothetical protein
MEGSKVSLFTPITNIGASAEGAEMITLWAPALRWGWHFSIVVKTPVDSITVWTPQAVRRGYWGGMHGSIGVMG